MKVLLIAGWVLLLFVSAVSAGDNFKEKLQKLTAIGEKAVADPKLPGGSIRVVEKGEVNFDRGFGYVDKRQTRTWTTSEVVAIASMSKPITATLVAVLVGQGKLSFDDPVGKYLPEYNNLKLGGSPVRSPTIAECLSHTSGFQGGTMKGIPRDHPMRKSQIEAANSLAAEGLHTEPGSKYAYTFRGYAAVAAVIEKVTGKPFPEVLATELLEPLSMDDTTFHPDAALVKRMPKFASRVAGLSIEQIEDKMEQKAPATPGSFVNVAGGLNSTPDDLVRFFRLHSQRGKVGERQLVPPGILAELYRGRPASPNYGMGFKRSGKKITGHGGATGTQGLVDLQNDRILIVLTQAGSANARPLIKGAMREVFGERVTF
ncbi:MAG: serine hydrolase [Verrucomicrobiales bacterium]|nr:serine hydrolase [Verrucomicrobiales bacterium]